MGTGQDSARKRSNRKYLEVREKGLCSACRKEKVVENKTYCRVCLLKKREMGKEYYRRKFQNLNIQNE